MRSPLTQTFTWLDEIDQPARRFYFTELHEPIREQDVLWIY